MVTTPLMTHSTGLCTDQRAATGARELERRRMRGVLRARLFGGPPPTFTLGRFRVERKLGEGAAGVVYAAYDPRMDRQVALKVLLAGDGDRRALVREARALAQLSHPNVLTVYEVHDEGDMAYVVSERVDGGTLRDWMQTPRTLAERTRMAVDVAAGITSAHRAGLVHRDLKPENILVGGDRPRIADFGLARLWAGAGGTLGATGRVVGTPGYMAPEQRQGAPPSPHNDQFSWGVVAYELLFGRHPLLADRHDAEGAGNPRPEGGPSPRAPRLDLDAPIPAPPDKHPAKLAWPVVRRSLDADPEARWADVEAAAAALTKALGADRHQRARTQRMIAAGVVGVAAAALTFAALTGPRPAQQAASAPTAPVLADDTGDPWPVLFEQVQPLMDRQDWRGCVDLLAPRVHTPTGRAVWVSCAVATGDATLVETACQAAAVDTAPPEACAPELRAAERLLAAGEPERCVKQLWEGTLRTSRGAVLVARCATLAPTLSIYACLYGSDVPGMAAVPGRCGLDTGLLRDARGVAIALDDFAAQLVDAGQRAACVKLLREHRRPNPEAFCR